MKFLHAVLIILSALFLQSTVNACHNAQHVKPSSDLDISGRRKRDVGPHPHPHSNHSSLKDADPELSLFFSDCMLRKTGQIFESWPSVIDFILRDLYWFEASDIAYCGGYKDTARCWQRRLNFLLKVSSSLLDPGKECIQEYDESIKSARGPEFELYYRTHYDSYQYEPVYGEFKRYKRQLFNGVEDPFKRAEDILNNLDDLLDTKFTTPRSYFQGETTTTKPGTSTEPEQGRECPNFSVFDFNVCVQTRVDNLAKTPIIEKYPSLRNFNEISNVRFFEDHLSDCRITKETRGKRVVYIENCPVGTSRKKRQVPSFLDPFLPRDQNEEEIYTPTPDTPSPSIPSYIPTPFFLQTPCLILDYPVVVKPSSPVHDEIKDCVDEILGEVYNATTEEPLPTTDPHDRSHLERPSKKGRIGVCTKDDAWTKFYNTHSPDGNGDFEILEDLLALYPELICATPKAIDVRVAKNNRPHFRSKELLYISLTDGLRCYNDEQADEGCVDYKVRFCCPKNPPCEAPNTWTEWYNRRRNKKFGDRDTLEYHKTNNNVCDQPVSIRARINGSKKPYWMGNNIVEISPFVGFICRDADQRGSRCRDYAVSFCCPLPQM